MRSSASRPPVLGNPSRGFTIVELVVTMIVVGILAATVVPRLADSRLFETRGFADEVLAAVQYARKVAVATRRNVCVVAAASTVTLTMATLAGSAAACAASVPSPAGGGAYVIAPRHGDVAVGDFSITFDGQGRTAAAANAAITGSGNFTLDVQAGTGYASVY